MVNAERNLRCKGDPENCWICECGKHHESEWGANRCCSEKKPDLSKCACRHCKK